MDGVSRNEIALRCLSGRCPNCGGFGMFRNWFRLNRNCKCCGMPLERDESGFYFGTTSIGYVLSILLVIIPICFLVVQEIIGMWTGVIIGIVGSVLLCIALYPVLLCWVILSYFLLQPNELTANQASDANDVKD
ncbi:MAG: DUF983 domain-containing protein [Coraliomargarita sp.]